MSRRRRQDYEGCSLNSNDGKLRLRWRPRDSKRHRSFSTGLDNTSENRTKLEDIRKLVGALLAAGKDPVPHLEASFARDREEEPIEQVDTLVAPEDTVAGYYEKWIHEQDVPGVRPSRLRDYRRHMKSYVLPALGALPLQSLRPKDLRSLRVDLLNTTSGKTGEPLKEKYVKNILEGSFAAMLRQARVDGIVLCDPTDGLEWGDIDPPEPDPFEPAERDRILEYFRTKRFGVHAGRSAEDSNRRRLHPHFHAYLHFLFWHGARPSEASGLWWEDIDLKRGTARIRRSYHMGHYGKPKTKSARRPIELDPDFVRLMEPLQPLKVTPKTPVFINTEGNPVEPKAFSERWYDALRALKLRPRGLYSTKDTFVTLTLATNREDVVFWLVKQTGVAYETLRRHYEGYLPKTQKGGMYARLAPQLKKGAKAA